MRKTQTHQCSSSQRVEHFLLNVSVYSIMLWHHWFNHYSQYIITSQALKLLAVSLTKDLVECELLNLADSRLIVESYVCLPYVKYSDIRTVINTDVSTKGKCVMEV